MAALTLQTLGLAGVTPSYASASAGGDTVAAPADERTFLHVKNGGGSAITVTINPVSPTSAKIAGLGNLAVPAIAVSVTNAQERMIGPIPAAYIDASGNINISYSAVTSVTIGAFRAPPISF